MPFGTYHFPDLRSCQHNFCYAPIFSGRNYSNIVHKRRDLGPELTLTK